jgi:SNF2 family DNA or RNA helicase
MWGHQSQALGRSRNLAPFAFTFDPGLGKTLTVIGEAGQMFLDGDIDTLVVIAPNRVSRQWVEKQFPKWAIFPYKGWVWPKGGLSSGVKTAAFEATLQVGEIQRKLRVFAFNFEAIRIPRGTKGHPPKLPDAILLLDRIMKTSVRGVYFCVDESHRTKDWTALQTRGVLRYSRQGVFPAKVRRTLTGTPILQGVHDLWSQYAFLDRNIISRKIGLADKGDADTFLDFRANFCKTAPVPGRPKAVRIVGAKNEAELMARIAPYTARVLDTEVLDMPAQVFDVFDVEMEGAQAKAYAQMDELMMAGLRTDTGGVVVTAKIVLTQLLRLQEIASGFVRDEDGTVHWLSDAKIDAIRERVEDLGGAPVVVWAPFIPLLERLEEVFGDKGTRFRSLDDIDVWRKKGGPLIANPASGGTGVDGMQLASRAFYAANSFWLEHRIQSIKRIHRGDQKAPCFYTDFVAKGSKDEWTLKALAAKRDVGVMTIDTLRTLLL